MSKIDTKNLPREILEKAITLRNCHKQLFIALYSFGLPMTAMQVAQVLGLARAYVHMRLLELCDRGLVKKTRKGRVAMFEVVR